MVIFIWMLFEHKCLLETTKRWKVLYKIGVDFKFSDHRSWQSYWFPALDFLVFYIQTTLLQDCNHFINKVPQIFTFSMQNFSEIIHAMCVLTHSTHNTMYVHVQKCTSSSTCRFPTLYTLPCLSEDHACEILFETSFVCIYTCSCINISFFSLEEIPGTEFKHFMKVYWSLWYDMIILKE